MRVLIVRHAEAGPGSPDDLRTLTPAGREQARGLGRRLREQGLEPDRVTLRKRCREFAAHWVGVHREEFKRLGLTSQLSLPAEPYRDCRLTNHHIYHQYVIRTAQRDTLHDYLTRREIGTAIYYPLGLHEQKCFAYLGYRTGEFQETERAARETLALPMYPELSHEAQRYVVETIAEFFA